MYSYSNDKIEQAYKAANEIYAAYGVDTDKAMEELKKSRFQFTVGKVTMWRDLKT